MAEVELNRETELHDQLKYLSKESQLWHECFNKAELARLETQRKLDRAYRAIREMGMLIDAMIKLISK
jgi:hypothetical protein